MSKFVYVVLVSHNGRHVGDIVVSSKELPTRYLRRLEVVEDAEESVHPAVDSVLGDAAVAPVARRRKKPEVTDGPDGAVPHGDPEDGTRPRAVPDDPA